MLIIHFLLLCTIVFINTYHTISEAHVVCNLVTPNQEITNNLSCGLAAMPMDSASKKNSIIRYQLMQEQVECFLRRCSQDEFTAYVAYQGVHGTSELVEHTEWWGYDVFWKHVESLPDGHEAIVAFATDFLDKNDLFLKRVWHYLWGEYKEGSRDKVAKKLAEHNTRYAETQAKQQLFIRKRQFEDQVQRVVIVERHEHAYELSQQVDQWKESNTNRLKQRAAAVESQDYLFQEYQFVLNETQKRFCQQNIGEWQRVYGYQLQQQLHQELLDCIDQAQNLDNNELLRQSITFAHQANRAGFVSRASRLVDLSYALMEGFTDGMISIIDAALNPFDTVLHTLKAACAVADGIAQCGQGAVQLAYYYATDEQKFYARYEDIVAYNNALCQKVEQYWQNTGTPTMVRQATGLVTEMIITHQCMQLVGNVCNKVAKVLPKIAQEYALEEAMLVSLNQPELQMQNAQFFAKEKQAEKIRLGQIATEDASKAVKECAKVGIFQEFFDDREFGKFLKNFCERVEGHHVQGESVYVITENLSQYNLRKGDRFYMDRWHRNHLEVFRKRSGKFLQEYVFNFDGTINEVETTKVLKQGRKLRS